MHHTNLSEGLPLAHVFLHLFDGRIILKKTFQNPLQVISTHNYQVLSCFELSLKSDKPQIFLNLEKFVNGKSLYSNVNLWVSYHSICRYYIWFFFLLNSSACSPQAKSREISIKYIPFNLKNIIILVVPVIRKA